MDTTNTDFDAAKFAQFQQFHQQFPQFLRELTQQPSNLQKFVTPKITNSDAAPPVKKSSVKKSSKKERKSKPKIVKPPNPFIHFAAKDEGASSKMKPKEVNILVIGETGVGKSTWINGIANYMSFNTFDDALNAKKPVCLIPMNFNLYVGEKYEKVSVNMKSTIGERDKNEADSSTGQSSTQEPKVYRYITDTFVFNLIDTPGIGDTRGIEYDMENMRMVLKCLSNWDKIHGICILLKPNVPRLTLSLRYCIEELLVNLHKNSIPNISVVFTNSCNTLYRPGDTMTVLKKLFYDVKESSGNFVHLSGANTFCIDNEAVRLLFAHQKGAEFEKDHIKNFSKSWKHTVNETYRLFEYVSGLTPHLADDTKATTLVRGALTELTTILAEMNEEILQKKKGCENQVRQLEALKKKLSEKLKQNLYEAECIENTPLSYPVTVCCGPNCIETVRIPNSDKQETFYKQICCSQCPLTNVTKNQIGEPNLRHCTAFGNDAFCESCGCSWQTHMHIWYSQKRTTGQFSTTTNEEEVNHIKLQIDAKSKYILQNENLLQELQKRYDLVFDLCHPYFEFLQQNSIIPLNNAMEEYLKLSIEELEKTLKPEDDRTELENLKKLLTIHQQHILLAKIANPGEEKIELSNYAEAISCLKNDETIGQKLKDSDSFQQLFETFESKIVEITPILEVKNVESNPKAESKDVETENLSEETRIVKSVVRKENFFQRALSRIRIYLERF